MYTKHLFLLLVVFLTFAIPSAQAEIFSPDDCAAIGGSCKRSIFGSNCDGDESPVAPCNVGSKSCCLVVKDTSGKTLTGQTAIDTFHSQYDSGAYTAALETVPPEKSAGASTLAATTITRPGTTSSETTGNFNYQLLEKIPGQSSTWSDLPSYIKSIINAALILIVLSAVFMVSVGGFLYLTSAGNTSKADQARKIITDSLIGLGLAMLAYLVLYIINPDLVNLKLSQLSATTPPPSSSAIPPSSVPTGATAAGCPTGIPCAACSGCEVITGVDYKSCGGGQCQLNSTLLGKIKNIRGVSGWRITESWPPTVNHLSSCHQNGTCADLNNSGGATDSATIKKYYDAFQSAGLDVLYESKDCASYTPVGIKCKSYPTMTNGSSFHVQ